MKFRSLLILVMAIVATLCVVVPAAAAAKFSAPVLLTSAGQSPDVAMAKVLMSKMSVTVNSKPAAKDSDLSGNKTVVFVIGYSSKGLGAAGIDLNNEVLRVKKLAQSARSAGMKVISMHIGGSARRGDSSNKLIEAVVPLSDAVIVVADGNKDKIFNQNLRDGADFFSVNKIAEASTPLAELFGK